MIESSAAGERQKWHKLIPIIVVVMAAVVFMLVFDVGQLKNFMEKYEKPGLIICLGVYVLLGVTVIPFVSLKLFPGAWTTQEARPGMELLALPAAKDEMLVKTGAEENTPPAYMPFSPMLTGKSTSGVKQKIGSGLRSR